MSVSCGQVTGAHLGSIPARAMDSSYKFEGIMRLNNLRMADADTLLHRFLPVVERRLPLWASLVFGLLIAWTLAKLTWTILPGPRLATPIYSAQTAAAMKFDAGKLADMHLFGAANIGGGPVNAPETTLNLILRGIVAASSDDKESLAIISSNGVEQLYAVGAQLPGGAQIQSIYPDHVLLSFNGRVQTLRLPKSGNAADSGDNSILPGVVPNVVYGSNLPAYQNLNQLRNELVSHPERLLDMMRAMPVMENGKLSGYRVFPVGNSDAFTKLGLQPGDVVTAVNGMPLDNPAQSMQILSGLKTSDQVSITFMRNGQQQTRVLQLQNPNN
ncbi:MAG: type II secretion system protein GspC [Gammaproteobacteria bacterium]